MASFGQFLNKHLRTGLYLLKVGNRYLSLKVILRDCNHLTDPNSGGRRFFASIGVGHSVPVVDVNHGIDTSHGGGNGIRRLISSSFPGFHYRKDSFCTNGVGHVKHHYTHAHGEGCIVHYHQNLLLGPYLSTCLHQKFCSLQQLKHYSLLSVI